MGGKLLQSKFGPVRFLKKNPRIIRADAMNKLMDSIERDPDFMIANPIKVDETGTILGGNQRCRALLALGFERIPDEWIRQVAHADGTPFTEEEKERLVYIDNSPEGISGDFDYDAMAADGTSLDLLRDVGIDIAKLDIPEPVRADFEDKATKEIEKSPIGEESETLKGMHERRAKSKEKFNDLSDVGFYSVLVFQTHEQRLAFSKWCSEHDVRAKYQGLFMNGEDLCKANEIAIPACHHGMIRARLPNAVLESMTLDGGIPKEKGFTQSQTSPQQVQAAE